MTRISLKITTSNCVELIALANRLWLPRLVTLVEAEIVNQMSSKLSLTSQSQHSITQKVAEPFNIANDSINDLSEEALSILQPCQVEYIFIKKTNIFNHKKFTIHIIINC